MPPLILALDFGGTKHTAAITYPGERNWQAHKRAFSPPHADASTDIEIMTSLAEELLAGRKPAAIGVSFGGPVNFKTGTVYLSHHVNAWENIPLQQLLEMEFGVPASVDNDANVAALGEHRFGIGQGYESLMYITVSTGVGGGLILNGKPWRGANGMAGEIGHTAIDPNGPLWFGRRGCVERLASGPFIAQQAREWLQAKPQQGQILRNLVNDNLEAITAEVVSKAAAEGDKIALQTLEKAAWALGVGIGNSANLINPQLFILGGGVAKTGEIFWKMLRKFARETAMPEVDFEIVYAALGDDAPLWGAVALAENLIGV
ncbi:MAG: ROK family protein [Symploca sp. SIO3C6]|uniref:ROK family protein n=1 Tax=Symploca sp. SIO1C4 TaxID=2607765 RepID=A0A6B3NCJ0_9CYAN|nr:ROK family protein [Symploca sp. SIO3C6]NER29310.1 ROK family protein [Symploca sp. SIO1C4]